MPISERIRNLIDSSQLPLEDYIKKIPTLTPEEFPDSVKLEDLASWSDYGQKLRELLQKAGLTKHQRATVTLILTSTSEVGEDRLTVGNIRELSLNDLFKLKPSFSSTVFGKPGDRSLQILKTLCGSKEEERVPVN
ncbi:hypothetical protein A2Z22_01555 [Candidatus Woesebacteria bacterium RBG_16_34_12]|uniref:Uncharacterized protein n=1 Tax=Candidatus Woesebacteria bacterium RBG_16_34_12 TaxID=1802480 RepID=A0A1F7XAT7_9BACT|nr:MAG: hypothetical protein A2Z22_01555 [Candidatus Woesebacteria bacterium RBG_16_34_12]